MKDKIIEFLIEEGLMDKNQSIVINRMNAGVSSMLWKIKVNSKNYCLKKSLKNLRVKNRWTAPITRNLNEFQYLKTVKSIVPDNLPKVISYNYKHQMFIMEYFEEQDFKNLKFILKDSVPSVSIVTKLADAIGKIHQYTNIERNVISKSFSDESIFFHTRISPYFLYLTKKHSNLKNIILSVLSLMEANKLALVHGDISPKNILVSKDRAILLDAECAWYGNPAFDIAFLLNHLLLKCLLNKHFYKEFLAFYDLIFKIYIKYITWEEPKHFEKRVSVILPILLLARVDGKCPVEYIIEGVLMDEVRKIAIYMIESSSIYSLLQIKEIWEKFLINKTSINY